MLADSGVEPLRGTFGVWKYHPMLKKLGITFDDLVREDFFQAHPSKFWYFWGSMYNRYRDLEPHEGYRELLEMLRYLKGDDGWFLYHEGIDLLYERAGKVVAEYSSSSFVLGYPADKLMQGKGNLFYW